MRAPFLILAILAPLGVVGPLFAWLVRPEPWAPNEHVRAIDADIAKKPFGAVVVGPSFARTDLDVTTLGAGLGLVPKRVVSIAVDRAGPPIWYATLKYRVFAAGARPKVVVVVAPVDALLSVRPAPARMGDLTEHYPQPDETIQALTFASHRPAWVERALERRNTLRAPVLDLFRNGPIELFFAEPGGPSAEAIADASGTTVFGEQHVDARFTLLGGRLAEPPGAPSVGFFGVHVEDPRDSYLPALARLVKENGARMVIALAPTSARTNARQYGSADQERAIVDLCNELGIGWIDLRDLRFGDERFFDGEHMRPDAAKEFTAEVARRTVAMGATGEGELTAAIPPLELAGAERIGAGALPPVGSFEPAGGPCKASLTLKDAAFLGDVALGKLPWRRRSPIEVVEDGVVLRHGPPDGELRSGCTGEVSHHADTIEVRRARKDGGALSVRLAEAVPVRDGKDDAWWVWPGTTLRWRYGSPPTATDGPLVVEVEVRPVQAPAAAPVLRVGTMTVPLTLRDGAFVGSLSAPRPEGAWAIEVESPAGGAFAEVRALRWQIGAQRQEVVAPVPTRWVDLVNGASIQGGAVPKARPVEPTTDGDHAWVAAPWRNTSGCSPLRVLADGSPLDPAVPDVFEAGKPPTTGLIHLKERLWFPVGAATAAYTMALAPERLCFAKGCKTCGRRVWVYPGDHVEVTIAEATRREAGGLRMAQLRVVMATADGSIPSAPARASVRLDGSARAEAEVAGPTGAAGVVIPVRPPVIGDTSGPLVVVLDNPAGNPALLFNLWGGTD